MANEKYSTAMSITELLRITTSYNDPTAVPTATMNSYALGLRVGNDGYGMMMLEEHKYTPSGYLLSRGPGTYKIPGFGNIPLEMNVSLLKGSANAHAVYSSKGIGEPPLFLASSVFFAVKEAIISARAEHGVTELFSYTSPATPEKIRLLCSDQFTDKFHAAKEGTYTPWYVQLS